MRPPSEESSAWVRVNRRKTVLVLTASTALLAVGFGWAALVGRDRRSPAELAASEYVEAMLVGRCDLARALLTEEERAPAGSAPVGCTEGIRSEGLVRSVRTEATGDDRAVVLVELDLRNNEDVERWRAIGVRLEPTSGRWQVDDGAVSCLAPPGWRAPAPCTRWSWP